jgi:hypothetical protein
VAARLHRLAARVFELFQVSAQFVHGSALSGPRGRRRFPRDMVRG